MRDLLSEALTEDGYSTVAEETAAGALSAINHHEFQVALVDLSLPDTNGMELIQSLAEGSPETHIIIMTGYPSVDTAIESIRHGARDYIVKPFKLPEVKGAVERSLRARQLEEEVRRLRRRVRELEEDNQAALPSPVRQQAPRRAAGIPSAYGAQPRPPQPDAEEDPNA